jgi:hypothetical protein
MFQLVKLQWRVLFVVGFQVLFLALLTATNSDQKVYIRNLVFSDFVSDGSTTTQQSVNALITKGFKMDEQPSAYLPSLNPRFEKELLSLKQDPTLGDRGLALAIVDRLGDPKESRICGVESLGKVVFDTDSGQGCCSDFSKAWLFYALYLGLQAREVNNLGHTTVEYWDKTLRKWVWLDPFFRMEMTNAQGLPLNQFEIRQMSLADAVRFVRLPGTHADFVPQAYGGYHPSQYAAISWRRGVNFLQVEAWDARLRALGLPKSLRQLALLTTGVQPRWLVLTSNALAFYMTLLQTLFLAVLAFFLAFDAWLAYRLARALRRRWGDECGAGGR